MKRTTTLQTVRHATLAAAALALGAATYVGPSAAAAHCPWTAWAYEPHGLAATDRDLALRTALFTFDDSILAEPRAALAADPQWARLPGVSGLRARSSRL